MSELEFANRVIRFSENRLSFLHKDRRTGWVELVPWIRSSTDAPVTEHFGLAESNQTENQLSLRGHYPGSGLEEKMTLTLLPSGGLTLSRKLSNPGPKAVCVDTISLGRREHKGGPVLAATKLMDHRLYHMDNLRSERYPICRFEGPNLQSVPFTPTWYGGEENNPLPLMTLTGRFYDEVLVDGQLSQRNARTRWLLAAAPRGDGYADYRLDWQLLGGGALLQAGEKLVLDPHYFSILEKVTPDQAAEEYYRETATHNSFRAPGSSLLESAFYCSWNYGIQDKVSEESLLKTAKAIAEHLPHVRFFLLDDGWQGREEVYSPDCANFYLPEERWIKKEKFPNGMKAYAEQIRALGLRPAIWWTPSVNLSSTLAKEHPEWLARDDKGGMFQIAGAGFLDLGHPEARGYLLKVWDILFRQWGFEALKIDFMTQAFASDSIRYSGGSTLHWRHWFLSTLRSYLPDDGFLMTCVAATQGNIFFGEYAESYRSCIDVCDGTWRRHLDACCWIQPLLSIPGKQTSLQNADGFGINPDIPDHENLHRLTYGLINMGSLEVDGRIEELSPRHLDWLKRLTANVDRGHVVRCPDKSVIDGSPFPATLIVDYPEDSSTRKRGILKHIAFFNWSDEERVIGATLKQLALDAPVTARDFWTDEVIQITTDGYCECMGGRSARLLEIKI